MCFWQWTECLCVHLVLWYHPPPHTHISRRTTWRGKNTMDNRSFVITHPSFLILALSPVSVPSLTTPPSHTFLLRQLRLSLSCFEPTSLILQSGWALSALWCAACLPCLPPSPLCWQSGGGGRDVYTANAPLLLPSACSVNPHCLVVLFELTWMLLFGFSACGSFFILNICFLLMVQKAWIPDFNSWWVILSLQYSPVSSQNSQKRMIGTRAKIALGCLVHFFYCDYTVQYVCKNVSMVCFDQSV